MSRELDIERPGALVAYLAEGGRLEPGERPAVEVLAGGVSNRTVLVRRENGEAWVLKQALEKLRVQADWFSSPERIRREAAGLRHLAPLLPPGRVPTLVFEDGDRHVLAMTAVPEPFENWKTTLLCGRLRAGHVNQFGELLGTIHGESSRRRAELEPAFADRSFFESLRLEPYYLYTASRVPEAAGFLRALVEETRAERSALVHGDYSPKNVLVHDGRLVLLDFEVIHFGDPAFDLGFALTHLLSKAHHLPRHRGGFARAAVGFWDTYREAAASFAASAGFARGLEARAVRHALACLLARVEGRSPLEYLTPAERRRQRSAVLALMPRPPSSLPALVEALINGVEGAAV